VDDDLDRRRLQMQAEAAKGTKNPQGPLVTACYRVLGVTATLCIVALMVSLTVHYVQVML
jgi:hypothetical protein